MDKFTQPQIDAKTPTGIEDHTDKYPVPAGENPNQYLQASELNKFNEKINQNTEDVKKLMIANNNVVDESTKKIYDSYFFNEQSGTDVFLDVGELGRSVIVLTSSGLTSVSGLNLLVEPDSNYETPFYGKKYTLINRTGNDVILSHDFTASLPNYNLNLKNSENMIIPNNGIIEFSFESTTLKEKFKNWVNPYILNYSFTGGAQEIAIPSTANILNVFLNDGRLLKKDIDYTISGTTLTVTYTLEVDDQIYITGLN